MVEIVGFDKNIAKKTNEELRLGPLFQHALLKVVNENGLNDWSKLDTKRQASKFFRCQGYVYNEFMKIRRSTEST